MRGTAVALFVGAALLASTTPRYAHALIHQGYCTNAVSPNNPTGTYYSNGVTCGPDTTGHCPPSQVPCVVNFHGAYVKQEIVTIFWDTNPSSWNSSPTNRAQVMAELHYMADSAYWGPLNQYGVSPPRLALLPESDRCA